jgi:peroxiredoxin
MLRAPVAAIPCLLLVVLVGCGERGPSPEETTLTTVGQPAPTFALVTLDGDAFDLAAQRGRVVVLSFWATWCPPCREEIPHLEKLWRELGGDGLSMVALAREEDEATVRAFLETTTMSYPVACDTDRSVYALYAERFIPRTVVVGPDGTILFQSSGFDEAEFAHMVELIRNQLTSLPEEVAVVAAGDDLT